MYLNAEVDYAACDIMLHFVLLKIITGQGHRVLINDDRKHSGILASSHLLSP